MVPGGRQTGYNCHQDFNVAIAWMMITMFDKKLVNFQSWYAYSHNAVIVGDEKIILNKYSTSYKST